MSFYETFAQLVILGNLAYIFCLPYSRFENMRELITLKIIT